MRKYIYKTYDNLKTNLDFLIKKSKSIVCNPYKISFSDILKEGANGILNKYLYVPIRVVTALDC